MANLMLLVLECFKLSQCVNSVFLGEHKAGLVTPTCGPADRMVFSASPLRWPILSLCTNWECGYTVKRSEESLTDLLLVNISLQQAEVGTAFLLCLVSKGSKLFSC